MSLRRVRRAQEHALPGCEERAVEVGGAQRRAPSIEEKGHRLGRRRGDGEGANDENVESSDLFH